jgi:hypothetical protein
MDPFDELRFGPTRTLNLRESLPTRAEAVRIADGWLRAKQVERAGEVLVITGRGRGSEGGIGVVRAEITKLLARLRRQHVVAEVREHTEGSFVVVLAPLRAMFEAAARKRDARRVSEAPAPRDPKALDGLAPEVRSRLRRLAELSLESLGVREVNERFVADEMERWFERLARAAAGDERALAAAIEGAIEEYDG